MVSPVDATSEKREGVELFTSLVDYGVCVRGGSSPKILGCIAPSAPSSPSPFYPFPETEKYELHIDLHLKSNEFATF